MPDPMTTPAPTGGSARPACWAGGSAVVERFARTLAEDLDRRGLLHELSEKSCSRLVAALAHAHGVSDLGQLAEQLTESAEVERLRAIERRAREAVADRPAAESIAPPWESVHQTAHYILTGETETDG